MMSGPVLVVWGLPLVGQDDSSTSRPPVRKKWIGGKYPAQVIDAVSDVVVGDRRCRTSQGDGDVRPGLNHKNPGTNTVGGTHIHLHRCNS